MKLEKGWVANKRFAHCENMGELQNAIFSYSQDIGVRFFSYLLIQNKTGSFSEHRDFFLNNYDAEWCKRYNERCYKHYDPVAIVSKRSRLPFFWDSRFFLRQFRKDQRRVFHEARQFNINAGYSIPVSGPNGDIGVFTLATNRSDQMDNIIHETAGDLLMNALHVHDKAISISLGHDRLTESGNGLTARELECLKWTAEGMTTDEIGNKICLASATVNYHLNKAVKKLDATNKHHAAIRGVRLGLI